MAGTTTFAYRGRTAEGKVVKGKLDAAGEGSVAAKLRTMGLSPISIAEAPEGTGLEREINLGFGSGVKLKDLAIMSRQMATMIGSGLSILRTLNIVAEQTENKKLAAIMAKVRDDVESGVAISDAMRKNSDGFPPLMINMIKAGETGGFLDSSLESIAENFEKEVKLRGTIKSALTYPVIVLCLSIVAVVAMLLFIVPVFENMFKQLGGTLPLPTQILVELSHAMVYIVPVLVVGGIVGGIWWVRNKNTEKVRMRVDPIKLKLPVFGPLMKKIAVARFSRNFANMI
ncbi:MAG: type II secretion system F family protein, partial [Leifsonia sp.]|uniref:type II secretion system F family protein n=1 Tax=Leifsonia sp. TaxID=1870902 RepID=UPI003F7FF1AF